MDAHGTNVTITLYTIGSYKLTHSTGKHYPIKTNQFKKMENALTPKNEYD